MKYLIGIDEVGRGALAGPVAIGVCAIPEKFKIRNKKLGKLYDSKKLNPNKRFLWYKYLINNLKIKYSFTIINPKLIDKINISNAANLAALRGLNKLVEKEKINLKNSKIFLDGGLYLKSFNYQIKNFPQAKTIISGDKKINCVKIASIIAKVKRDNFMINLAKRYSNYFFDKHKGYGTKIHLSAIKKYGVTDVHRLTFV